MRIIALLAAYNEERFITNCLEHLLGQGVDAYLIDNGSTDDTVAIAERYIGRGLVGIEPMPREGLFDLRRILSRKEELAAILDADWFIHMDADEIRRPPHASQTLGEALAETDAAGFNAVNFREFTFVPTIEAPDHDHPRYLETMRWYYPFGPFFPQKLSAWKRQPDRIELAALGGHAVRFEGLRMSPQPFVMRHYLCLSAAHAARKYAGRRHVASALAEGWHGWREQLDQSRITLPSQAELRPYTGDDALDPSEPRSVHLVIGPSG